MTSDELAKSRCTPCTGVADRLAPARVQGLLAALPGWEVVDNTVTKAFRFRNYEETLAFVNRVAQMAQSEDHHPDIAFGYNRCHVAYTTHAVGGLSMNDFICAAKVEALAS